jgi:hypothetical protein
MQGSFDAVGVAARVQSVLRTREPCQALVVLGVESFVVLGCLITFLQDLLQDDKYVALIQAVCFALIKHRLPHHGRALNLQAWDKPLQ